MFAHLVVPPKFLVEDESRPSRSYQCRLLYYNILFRFLEFQSFFHLIIISSLTYMPFSSCDYSFFL